MWFTDGGDTRAIGRITPSGQINEFSSGLNTKSLPVDIAAGPDGNLWFTDEGDTTAIGRITPSAQIVEFSGGLALEDAPFGIAPGADGNLWFANFDTNRALARIGADAPAALQSPPALSGLGDAGEAETCGSPEWSTWAGFTPATTLFGFDGYRWLRDGATIPGQAGATYTPTNGDVGHQLSCQVTVTYPVPLLVTASAASGRITVGPAPPAPPPPPARVTLSSIRTSGATASVVAACHGSSGQTCTGTINVTTHITTRGRTIVAVTAAARARTKLVTVARASFGVVPGASAHLRLNLSAVGRQALLARYRLPATLSLTGTTSAVATIVYSYPQILTGISYDATLSPRRGATISVSALQFRGIPRGAAVQMVCRRGHCRPSRRTFHTRRANLFVGNRVVVVRLAYRAAVDFEVTLTGRVGRVLEVTNVGAGPPSYTYLCRPPGIKTPVACA